MLTPETAPDLYDSRDRRAFERGWNSARAMHGCSPQDRLIAYNGGQYYEPSGTRGAWADGWAHYVECNASETRGFARRGAWASDCDAIAGTFDC